MCLEYISEANPVLFADTVSAASSTILQRLENRAALIVLSRDSFKDSFNILGWVELGTAKKAWMYFSV